MPTAIVIGGGLAGLAAAAALGESGFQVDLFEARGFLGGRATSYALPSETGETEVIDNCQHVLLRCCVNLMDFYRRLGVADRIKFYKQFYFIEPGGRISTLGAGRLPAPLHFTGSFWKLHFLGAGDKLAIARALLAIRREHGRRGDLERITMLDWLREKRQTERAIRRFWSQVLVSAINEDLDRMAASHGFQVFWLGFLARSNSYEMGVRRCRWANCMVRKPGSALATCGCICGRQWSGRLSRTIRFARSFRKVKSAPRIIMFRRFRSSARRPCSRNSIWRSAALSIRRSPAFICGSTAA